MWIGVAEANAITVEQHGVSLPRPMTHQLIGNVVDAVHTELEKQAARSRLDVPSANLTPTVRERLLGQPVPLR